MALAMCSRLLLQKRNPFGAVVRNQGYIVLVPEIGEDISEKNGLLQGDGLPQFNNITIENCMAMVAKQTMEFETGVERLEQTIQEKQANLDIFRDVFDVLEVLGVQLDATWGIAKTLYLGNSTLMPSSSYMGIHDRARRARMTKYNSEPIFNAVTTALANLDPNCSNEQKRLLHKFALEGKLNGLALDTKSKTILLELWNKLLNSKMQYRLKTDLATSEFFHRVGDGAAMRDFPVDILESISANPKDPLSGPWTLTLQPHIYQAALENCHDREIRWNLWQASVNRGSNFVDSNTKTTLHVEEIRITRRNIANRLGYQTFADMSMETKMAGSLEKVNQTLYSMIECAKPVQDLELQELHAFALERGFKGSRIELWDVPYWKKKHLKSELQFKEEAYKEYFPLPKVLEGMFGLCEKLFNVVIKRRDGVSTWSKDVKFYDVYENHTSAPIGGFYLDPYFRNKEKPDTQPNAGWFVAIQNQRIATQTKPLASLIFNFEPPSNDRDSHLSLKDLKNLFHKFGLALQHILTRTNYSELSGSSNIEWDAVEVSGHFLTHWLQDKQVMDSISCNSETKEKLSQELFDQLLKVNGHMAGLELSRELYLSALDLELYSSKDYWLDVVRRLWPQFRSFPLDKMDSHPCSFTQIFTEDWAAAYYSNIWSRMLAADIYAAFKEDNRESETGKRFRDTFLLYGGSSHSADVFRQFRGRDPSAEALLDHLGLKRTRLVE